MISGAALPLVIMMGGVAIDYSFLVLNQQSVQGAIDNAALAAANEANLAYVSNEDIDFEQEMMDIGGETFDASVANLNGVTITNFFIDPTVNRNVIDVEVSSSASYETILLHIFGYDTIDFQVETTVQVASPTYMNFTYLIDVSASMGIGATDADMQIVNNTAGCAISCHLGIHTSYQRSRDAGAEMRIDVAREAVIDTLDIIKRNTTVANQFTIGAHIYDNVSIEVSSHTDSRSTDLDWVEDNIKNGVFMQASGGGTNTSKAIQDLAAQLPASGSGRNADNRRQVIVVFTDGVENAAAWAIDGRPNWQRHPDYAAYVNEPSFEIRPTNANKIYAMDTSVCDVLATKDIAIYFIHTEYLRPTAGKRNDRRFDFIEDNLKDLSPQRFKTCAGESDNVIETSTPEEIAAAFNKIVNEVTAPLYLKTS